MKLTRNKPYTIHSIIWKNIEHRMLFNIRYTLYDHYVHIYIYIYTHAHSVQRGVQITGWQAMLILVNRTDMAVTGHGAQSLFDICR